MNAHLSRLCNTESDPYSQYRLRSLQPIHTQILTAIGKNGWNYSNSDIIHEKLMNIWLEKQDDQILQQRNVLPCYLLVHVVVFEEKPSELYVCNELTKKFNKIQTILTVLCFIFIRLTLSFKI